MRLWRSRAAVGALVGAVLLLVTAAVAYAKVTDQYLDGGSDAAVAEPVASPDDLLPWQGDGITDESLWQLIGDAPNTNAAIQMVDAVEEGAVGSGLIADPWAAGLPVKMGVGTGFSGLSYETPSFDVRWAYYDLQAPQTSNLCGDASAGGSDCEFDRVVPGQQVLVGFTPSGQHLTWTVPEPGMLLFSANTGCAGQFEVGANCVNNGGGGRQPVSVTAGSSQETTLNGLGAAWLHLEYSTGLSYAGSTVYVYFIRQTGSSEPVPVRVTQRGTLGPYMGESPAAGLGSTVAQVGLHHIGETLRAILEDGDHEVARAVMDGLLSGTCTILCDTTATPGDPGTGGGTQPWVPIYLPQPLPGETFESYFERLAARQWLGAAIVHDDSTDYPQGSAGAQAAPGTIMSITTRGTTIHRFTPLGVPINWPVGVRGVIPKIARQDQQIAVRVKPAGSGGSGVPAINMAPLTGALTGLCKFPFGVICWVGGIVGQFNTDPVAPGVDWHIPTVSTPGHSHILGGQRYDVELSWLDTFMGWARLMESFVLWAGAVWYVGSRLIGIRGGGDPSVAVDAAMGDITG